MTRKIRGLTALEVFFSQIWTLPSDCLLLQKKNVVGVKASRDERDDALILKRKREARFLPKKFLGQLRTRRGGGDDRRLILVPIFFIL